MLDVPAAGRYRFRLSSDDSSALWFDDELIVDNDSGPHPMRSVESQDVPLAVGRQPIRVQWYNSGGDGALCLEWRTPPGTDYEAIPAASFTPAG